MKVRNDSESTFDPGGNRAPWLFYGDIAPDTSKRFIDAPLLSEYWDVSGAVKYVKIANNKAAADWKPTVIIGSTITGDVTISGTLTAGDVVATAG